MAFQSNGPVLLALPPFRGVTRRIVLLAAAAFLAIWVLSWTWSSAATFLFSHLVLQPWSLAHGMVWQMVTYPFIDFGLLSVAFALLTVWFFGSRLEDDLGGRWLLEYFLAVTAGGAVLATLLTLAVGLWGNPSWGAQLGPRSAITAGMWPAAMAILLAFARFHPEEELRLYFVLRLKAKHLAAIFLGGYLLLAVFSHNSFGALVVLMNALCGWIFLKGVPRRGLRYTASERWYGLRNTFYRNKRKRAAKEFEVYMRKQGKDVRVDDSDDKKWMN